MNSKERMNEWKKLPPNTIAWETFKRLVGQFGMDKGIKQAQKIIAKKSWQKLKTCQTRPMSKKIMKTRQSSKYGKKTSHTGNLPLVESLTDPNVMVRPKVRLAQQNNREVRK